MKHEIVIAELTRRIGLNPDSLGQTAVQHAIDVRMKSRGLGDDAAYAALICADQQELQSLINEIVVSETWFFRGNEFFDTVIQYVRQFLTNRSPNVPIRILSVACSTGEEPYSMAMALDRAGIPPDRFRIDAVDVSTKNIDIARLGRYSEFSFRQLDGELRKRYFQETVPGIWQLTSSIRANVSFKNANILDSFFLRDELPYDIIACRNVFIYFTAASRLTAIQHLMSILNPGGLLALGHAESSDLSEPTWTRHGVEAACVFQYMGNDVHFSNRPNPFSLQTRLPAVKPPLPPDEEQFATFDQRRPITKSGQYRRPLPLFRHGTKLTGMKDQDCWNVIGVRGDHSCKELAKYDHCHNCHVFSTAGRRFLDNASPRDYLDEWTERLAVPIVEAGKDLENVLIFRIRDEWLALPVSSIVEVTLPRPFHRVPHRGGILDGLINIRGELHLLVRVDEVIGLTPPGEEQPMTRKTRLIVAGKSPDFWAFVVNEVDRVRRYPAEEVMTVPTTVARSTGRFSKGVLIGDGRMTGLLDEAKLFEALRARLT